MLGILLIPFALAMIPIIGAIVERIKENRRRSKEVQDGLVLVSTCLEDVKAMQTELLNSLSSKKNN